MRATTKTNKLISQLFVIKISPLGVWSTREAGWVLFHEDSANARTRVRAAIQRGKLRMTKPKESQWDRTLITTSELEHYIYVYLARRSVKIKINEAEWMRGKQITHVEYVREQTAGDNSSENTPKLGEIIQ